MGDVVDLRREVAARNVGVMLEAMEPRQRLSVLLDVLVGEARACGGDLGVFVALVHAALRDRLGVGA